MFPLLPHPPASPFLSISKIKPYGDYLAPAVGRLGRLWPSVHAQYRRLWGVQGLGLITAEQSTRHRCHRGYNRLPHTRITSFAPVLPPSAHGGVW